MPLCTLTIETTGRGLYEITPRVMSAVRDLCTPPEGHAADPLCTVFIRHTSASLLIQENADPSARRDLETWMDRFVPDADRGRSWYTHTSEGPDDMPAHIRAAITATSLTIPVENGVLCLGVWQGIYLWEHRTRPHRREVVVHLR